MFYFKTSNMATDGWWKFSSLLNTDGWKRMSSLYSASAPNMEIDATLRATRMSFLVGFIAGAATTAYSPRKEDYIRSSSTNSVLRIQNFPCKRTIIKLAASLKNGLSMGLKSATIVGSVMFMTTHLTVWRDRFCFWYFPVISSANAVILHRVGSILSFPSGRRGTLKSLGLGFSSGLSLSLIVYMYALNIDSSMDGAYRSIKTDYENELRRKRNEDNLIRSFMNDKKIRWRYIARREMRNEEDEKLLDDDAASD
ncbi:hypothetical protein AB6A40_001559 [Gnathostoma spinigerum]|uniref:Complex I assembly factor TIMMDC1, mitochondrial n=1 Tax=Gnathostoma spinigerum TaxID=75299 RepID=A0ABD6EEU1_9BILA